MKELTIKMVFLATLLSLLNATNAKASDSELQKCLFGLRSLVEGPLDENSTFSIQSAESTPPIILSLSRSVDTNEITSIEAYGKVLHENLFESYATIKRIVEYVKSLGSQDLNQLERDLTQDISDQEESTMINLTRNLLIAFTILHEVDHELAKKLSLQFLERAPKEKSARPPSLVYHYLRSLSFKEPEYFAAIMEVSQPEDFQGEASLINEVMFWTNLLRDNEQASLISDEKIETYVHFLVQDSIHLARQENFDSSKKFAERLSVDPFDFFSTDPVRITQQKVVLWAQASRIQYALDLIREAKRVLRKRGKSTKRVNQFQQLEKNLRKIEEGYFQRYEEVSSFLNKKD